MTDIRDFIMRRNGIISVLLVWTAVFIAGATARADYMPVFSIESGSALICWTATGDDGYYGKAAQYDIRYSRYAPGADTVVWWENCRQFEFEPDPLNPGEKQCSVIDNLDEGIEYFFAMKVADEAGNWSAISNIASTIYEYHACADVDNDGLFSLLDLIYLVDVLFREGPPPAEGTGNVNGDLHINILDLIYLIEFKYYEGAPPLCN